MRHAGQWTWLLCGLFLACGCGPTPGRVRTVRDEFSGTTTVEVSDMAVAGGPTGGALVNVYAVPGGNDVRWTLSVDPPGWAYLECHTFDFMADGHPVPHGESEHNGSVITGGVTETVSTTMAAADFVQLARSADVRARVCNDVYRFTPEEIRTFRALVARMQAGAR